MPAPLSETLCVLPVTPPSLSLIVKLPSRAPVAVGLKVTEIVHCSPESKFVPQSLVCVKSPVAVMPVMGKGASLKLLSVTVCTLLLQMAWAGERNEVGTVLDF